MPQIYVDYIKNILKQAKIICISKCFTKYLKDSQGGFMLYDLSWKCRAVLLTHLAGGTNGAY